MKMRTTEILLSCICLFMALFIIYDSATGLGIIADKRVKLLLIGFIIVSSIRNIRRDWKNRK